MSKPSFKRILLKVSGEVLAGDQSFGIETAFLEATAKQIAEAARANGLDAQVCASLDEALGLALAGDGPAPHVLICGSLYLAGEVLAASPQTWPV